jgi:hypothetical protein
VLTYPRNWALVTFPIFEELFSDTTETSTLPRKINKTKNRLVKVEF